MDGKYQLRMGVVHHQEHNFQLQQSRPGECIMRCKCVLFNQRAVARAICIPAMFLKAMFLCDAQSPKALSTQGHAAFVRMKLRKQYLEFGTRRCDRRGCRQ